MLPALELLIFPTLTCYLIFSGCRFIRSRILRVVVAWFIGQYVSGLIIFSLSVIFNIATSNVLAKSSLLVTTISVIATIFVIFNHFKLSKIRITRIRLPSILKVILVLLSAFLSVAIFTVHLNQRGGIIYTSPTYWDFKIHVPIIQNFAWGDNFPPENMQFTNLPLTYHYFFDFLVAVYASLGLNLVSAVNLLSVISFTAMLLGIIGLAEEFFHSTAIGIIAAIFTLTSSSLRFFDYFATHWGTKFTDMIRGILTNIEHPFVFSFVKGNPFGYNGTMFNMFYFVEERQMIFAVLYLIATLTIFLYIHKLSILRCLLFGALLGLFFQWHLFATINASLIALILLFTHENRRKKLAVLAGFAITFGIQTLYFKFVTRSEWFLPDISTFPRINFNFPTLGTNYPLTLLNAIGYYVYAYGIKIVFLVSGLVALFKRNRNVFWLTTALIIPAFILTNTVQLSPISVYDNHKWIRAMNVFVDIVAAYALVIIFLKKGVVMKLVSILSFILLTLSGLMEIMPFINSRPTLAYADYGSPVIAKIRMLTKPSDIFLSDDPTILLAGRKVFFQGVAGQDFRLDINRRAQMRENIYSAPDIPTFCSLTKLFTIKYVEVRKDRETKDSPIFKSLLTAAPALELKDSARNMVFIDTAKVCKI